MFTATNEPTLLVAMPAMADPNFQQSVILLVEHNEEGSLGFVINKQCHLPLMELIDPPAGLEIPPALEAWVGGPVEPESGLILTLDERAPHGYALTAEAEALENMIQRSTSAESLLPDYLYPYRFLVGYAGWGPEQLDHELRNGAWIHTPLDLNIIFDTPSQKMWSKCMASLGCSPEAMVVHQQSYLH